MMVRLLQRMGVRLATAVLVLGTAAGASSGVQAASHSRSVKQPILLADKSHHSDQGRKSKSNSDGNPPSSSSGGSTSLPETPYAILFPVAIAGVTWTVYRKRQRQSQ